MNHKRIIISLCLLNVAVLIAAVAFVPGQGGYGYSWNSEIEQQVKRFLHGALHTDWAVVSTIMVISVMLSVAVYLFATGIGTSGQRNTDPSEHPAVPDPR